MNYFIRLIIACVYTVFLVYVLNKFHKKDAEKIKQQLSKTNYSINVYLKGDNNGKDIHVNTFYPEENVEMSLKKMSRHYLRQGEIDNLDPNLYFIVTENTIVSNPVARYSMKKYLGEKSFRALTNI